MPASADIYGLVKPPQAPNRLEQYAQMAQITGLQNQSDLAQYTIGKAKREDEDNTALRADLAGGVNPMQALLNRGRVKEAGEYQKTQDDRKKTVAETGKIDLETGIKKAEHAASVLSLATDQASYDKVRSVLGSTFGEASIAQMPPVFDRGYIQAEVAKGMTRAQQLADMRAKEGHDVTARGQDMLDRRTREEGAANRKQAQAHFDAGQNGVKYEKDGDGNLVAVPVKPGAGGPIVGRPVMGMDGKPLAAGGGKAMTEGQAKANLFGTRMQEADKVLAAMEKEGVLRPGAIKGVAETVGNIAGLGTESMGGALADAAGNLTNWTQSSEQQRVEQAQRDFINADLRRESGASISPAEFRNGQKQYFPQPGDDSKTLAQKARNRQIATQGILAEVPEKQRTKPAPAEPEAPTAFSDAGKESRYQAWKRSQGGK